MQKSPKILYRILVGRNGVKYRVEKKPDFSKLDYKKSNGNVIKRDIEEQGEIQSGKMMFNLVVDFLKKSSIKTNAKIEYGSLRNGDCKIRPENAMVYANTGRISFYKGRIFYYFEQPSPGEDKYISITYQIPILARNPKCTVKFADEKTQKVSNNIGKIVDEIHARRKLDIRYFPNINIGAYYHQSTNTWYEMCADIIARFLVKDGKLPKFDIYSKLIGNVDEMLLNYIRDKKFNHK